MYEIYYIMFGAIITGVIVFNPVIRIPIKTVAAAIFIIIALNHFGLLAWLNPPINVLIAGEPLPKCQFDSDCKIKQTTCNYCDCGVPVYKEWDEFCPLKQIEDPQCAPCPPQEKLECKNYRCTLINFTS